MIITKRATTNTRTKTTITTSMTTTTYAGGLLLSQVHRLRLLCLLLHVYRLRLLYYKFIVYGYFVYRTRGTMGNWGATRADGEKESQASPSASWKTFGVHFRHKGYKTLLLLLLGHRLRILHFPPYSPPFRSAVGGWAGGWPREDTESVKWNLLAVATTTTTTTTTSSHQPQERNDPCFMKILFAQTKEGPLLATVKPYPVLCSFTTTTTTTTTVLLLPVGYGC